jgi:hypothetical protein
MSSLMFSILATAVTAFSLINEGSIAVFNTQKAAYHDQLPFLTQATPEELMNEPQMKAASSAFAEEEGGPLTRQILSRLKDLLGEEDYKRLHVDVKVQEIFPGAYSNDPGWHSDYYATVDTEKERLVHLNGELDEQTRLFFVTSGEPTTEFIKKDHMIASLDLPSWEALSEAIDEKVADQDLYRIPVAQIFEAKGNEIHRVTKHVGTEPTIRYFMRATLFPKGHTFENQIKNELFSWAPYNAVNSVLGDVEGFISSAFAHMEESGIDPAEYPLTHLCYRVATLEEYEAKKEALSQLGEPIQEFEAEGRPYMTFKLHQPIAFGDHKVDLIALPAPKAGKAYQTGLQHVAFLTDMPLPDLLKKYPDVQFDTLEVDRPVHKELKIHFDDLVVKFHNESLENI